MIERGQIHEGMTVRSSDGRRLGRVLACQESTFLVEKGFYFATDYVARYDEVADVSGDEVRLSRNEEALAHGERAFKREGGLGESFTYGGGIETSPMAPRALAEDEAEARRGSVREDEDERPTSYRLGGRDTLPQCWGDEGGGGLL